MSTFMLKKFFVLILVGSFSHTPWAMGRQPTSRPKTQILVIDGVYSMRLPGSNGGKPLPVFAGFDNTESDLNRITVIDKICQYLGFAEAGNYIRSSYIGVQSPEMLVIEEGPSGWSVTAKSFYSETCTPEQFSHCASYIERLACIPY